MAKSYLTSGRGSATNPSRLGILTFGRLAASMTCVFVNDAVQVQDEGDRRVHLGGLEQPGSVERHRPIDVVPHVVAYGQKLPTVLSGFGVASVPCPPTSRAPTPPSPFGPWQRAHSRQRRPSCGDRSRASGQTRSVGRDRRPEIADLFRCRRPADSVSRRLRRQAWQSPPAPDTLSFHIGHGPVGADLPELDAVVVIDGVRAARRDQRLRVGWT